MYAMFVGKLNPLQTRRKSAILSVLALASVALFANLVVAQGAPKCPSDWPGQGYDGALRDSDYGRILFQDFHTDGDGQPWFVIRSSDINGYTTVRAYPASGEAGIPDQRAARGLLPDRSPAGRDRRRCAAQAGGVPKGPEAHRATNSPVSVTVPFAVTITVSFSVPIAISNTASPNAKPAGVAGGGSGRTGHG